MRFEKTSSDHLIKPEIEKWIARLEKDVSKRLDKTDDHRQVARDIAQKLEDENYYELIGEIFLSLNHFRNKDYFTFYTRFVDAVSSIDKHEELFMHYTDWPFYNTLFSANGEIYEDFFSEVTSEIVIDGKTYSLAEYFKLARKIHSVNLSLIGDLIWSSNYKKLAFPTIEERTKIFNLEE
ncbi:hypothetical protein [Pseudomonas sp. HY7a-MNA-CIBAN-0227]|uniref:hypothetical protein n=1 Tax=Pseudomonas sp. HY7a-MNA-CIBAN-0227 TaxID=3140474 RepID=UPI00331C9089